MARSTRMAAVGFFLVLLAGCGDDGPDSIAERTYRGFPAGVAHPPSTATHARSLSSNPATDSP